MSKLKDDMRAKAEQKAKKRAANAEQPAPTIRPGQFDPKDKSLSNPGANAGGKNAGAVRRGSARSR